MFATSFSYPILMQKVRSKVAAFDEVAAGVLLHRRRVPHDHVVAAEHVRLLSDHVPLPSLHQPVESAQLSEFGLPQFAKQEAHASPAAPGTPDVLSLLRQSPPAHLPHVHHSSPALEHLGDELVVVVGLVQAEGGDRGFGVAGEGEGRDVGHGQEGSQEGLVVHVVGLQGTCRFYHCNPQLLGEFS